MKKHRILIAMLICCVSLPLCSWASDNSIGSISVVQQKTYKISGTVVDENGESIIGANIAIKGSKTFTVTDIDGKFSLFCPQGSLLVVSYIGYNRETVSVNFEAPMNIVLKENNNVLNDVIVVGYGTVKRANLAGSVSSISSKELQDIPAKDLASTLVGTMPGVSVSESSGSPTSEASIKVRIQGSYSTDEDPLYVIDGFIRDADAFNVLDPSEIESISVLKDASASVYGSRAAGGVILVTTKKGQAGKIKLNYSGSYGLSVGASMPKMMSAYQQAKMLNDYYDSEVSGGETIKSSSYYSDDELEAFKGLNYNWLDMGWKTAINTRHTLNVSGGNEITQYFVGGSYMYQDGNFKNLDMNRFSTRLGINTLLTKDLKAEFSMDFSDKIVNRPYNNGDKEIEKLYGTFGTLVRMPRWMPAYINGYPVGNAVTATNGHPLEAINSGSYNKNTSTSFAMGAALHYNVPWIKGLNLNLSVNYANANDKGIKVARSYSVYNYLTDGTNGHIITDEMQSGSSSSTEIENGEQLNKSYSNTWSYQVNPSISYSRKLGKHDFSGLLVFEQSENKGDNLSASRVDAYDTTYNLMQGYSSTGETISDGISNGARQSYIGRLNYNYNDRYFIEATARYEGSTIFHPDSRWGLFPAVSLGWRMSEESWFKSLCPAIDDLKLRASYGRVGNDAGNTRAWEQSYESTNGVFLGNTSSISIGLRPRNEGVLSSKSVTWEKTDSYNFGIDSHFLKNWTFNSDFYFRHTFDILDKTNSTVPTTVGIANALPYRNYGIENAWGAEFSLGYLKQITRDWSVSATGIFSYGNNKIIRKYQAASAKGTWKDEEGQHTSGEVGYECMGIARTTEDAQNYVNYLKSNLRSDGSSASEIEVFGLKEADLLKPGYLMFKDLGGTSDADRTADGKIDDYDQNHITKLASNPCSYSLKLGARWKDLSIDLLFDGSFGAQVRYDKGFFADNSGNRASAWLSDTSNNLAEWYGNYWTENNTNAKYPKLYNGFREYSSSFWVRNGHELKLRNVNVSYILPHKYLALLGIDQLRVYFTGTNLWTIVNPYKYKDADVSNWVDYPMIRTFNFGVNLTF
jgi:TonB-linked SusC/RagA family outer membrane protein